MSAHWPQRRTFRLPPLIAGGVGAFALVAAAIFDTEQFFRSYLSAFLLWSGFTLGSVAVLMIHHLSGGGWGFLLRRILEAAARTWPLLALLAIPIFFGLPELYEWARPEAVAADEKLQHKEPYLNAAFFIVRTGVYFVVWGWLIERLDRASRAQDESDDVRHLLRLRNTSGPGLILYALTLLFAGIDWAMSLEPLWYSTVFSASLMVGQALSALLFGAFWLRWMADDEDLAALVQPKFLNDASNMILTFLMLWAYTQLSQFLIIWSGNIAEETVWYVNRTEGVWNWVSVTLAVAHFVIPFLLLLQRPWKRSIQRLSLLAGGVLLLRALTAVWLVEPTFGEASLYQFAADGLAMIALGGLWLAFFSWRLADRPLLPLRDPRLPGTRQLLEAERVGDV